MVSTNIFRFLILNHAFSNSQGQGLKKQINMVGNLVFNEQKRTLFNVSKEPDTKYFCTKELIGHSKERMFQVICDVQNYPKFLPWCKETFITNWDEEHIEAKLNVGSKLMKDSYTMFLSLQKPHLIKIDCVNGKYVQHLGSVWNLGPGISSVPQSCVVDFQMCMKFNPAVRSYLIRYFFDALTGEMQWAFLDEVDKRFGAATIPPKKLLRSSYVQY